MTRSCSHRYAALQARFSQCLQCVGATGDTLTPFHALLARYGEPHRAYHDLRHIEACLAWLDWLAGSAEQRDEVELALWFHDAVYVPGARDNEARSAELVWQVLPEAGVDAPVVARVARMVEATAAHDAVHGDAALVTDIDLAILGAAPAAFAAFEADVRREYAHVPADVYRRGRRAVLESFARRERIYRTTAVAEILEAPARRNLSRALQALVEPSEEVHQ